MVEEQLGHGGLERELTTTATLLPEDHFNVSWGRRLPHEKLAPESHRAWPYFSKRVMKGCTHLTPQSVICVPMPFMRQHPDTFRAGNLITLEGPSGNTWRVRASDKPILHSGWRAFAHDHDLRVGDHLRFNLIHQSHFLVEVLDGVGEVKGSALSATNTGKYTVASIANPNDYVRRARKRKRTSASPRLVKPPRRRCRLVQAPTIASRCKTTARRRKESKESHKTLSQWMGHAEIIDGHEVVTILDSDDGNDKAVEEDNRLVDHIELSFGIAKMQRCKTSKIQRLVKYMKAHGNHCVPQCSVSGRALKLAICESLATNPAFNAEDQAKEAEMAKRNSTTVGSCDKAVTVNKDPVDETHLKVEVGNYSDHPDHQALQAQAIPGENREGEPQVTVNPATQYAVRHPSLELTTDAAASAMARAEAGAGEFLFATLQSIVDMPAIANPAKGDQKRAGVRRDPIIHELPEKNHDARVLDLNKSSDVEHEDNMVQHKPSSDSATAMSIHSIHGYHSYGNVALGSTCGDETKQQGLHFLQPPKATISHLRRPHLEFKQLLNNCVTSDSDIRTPKKTMIEVLQGARSRPPYPASVDPGASTDLCVLQSIRGKVGNLDREKTLKAAQACTKKLRNPHFVAIMQNCNVYHDFLMDVPGEFAKKCRLPATESRAMLICDEVPTMCRAVWDGARLRARGWMEFSRTHYLEEGDVCVFELHNRVAVRIGVHIFRVVGLRRGLVDWTQHYTVVRLGTVVQHTHRSTSVTPGSTRAAPLEVL